MLDTGAVFPIWTDEEDILSLIGGKLVKKDISFGGFGGEAKGSLYRLQNVVVGELIFPDIYI